MPDRIQKYRIKWPLTPTQVINIDEMFAEIYRDLYNHTVKVNVDQIIGLTTTTSPVNIAGLQLLNRDGEDGERGWPGLAGQAGSIGKQGSPGFDGQDGEDAAQWPWFIPNNLAHLGIIKKITTVTDTYTVLQSDETIICNKASAFTVTLPVTVIGQTFVIKNIGLGAVTVDGDSTDTINGELTQTVNQWESMQIICYAANSWGVI
jgi:hypothetical protein